MELGVTVQRIGMTSRPNSACRLASIGENSSLRLNVGSTGRLAASKPQPAKANAFCERSSAGGLRGSSSSAGRANGSSVGRAQSSAVRAEGNSGSGGHPDKAERAQPVPRGALSSKKPAPGEPIGMKRAKAWSPEVEDAFRLQEAGYRGVAEMVALGLPPPERWPEHEGGFIRKLQTRHSFDAGERVLLYFRRAPECEPRYLNRVKLYQFAT